MILEAALAVGYPWSPAEIVGRLKKLSPSLFSGLRPQRISDWRGLSIRDALVWKDSVIKRVSRGYRQGFDNTRKTILVSNVNTSSIGTQATYTIWIPCSVTTLS